MTSTESSTESSTGMTGDRKVETALFQCKNCGSFKTDADLGAMRAVDPRVRSCCPERKMQAPLLNRLEEICDEIFSEWDKGMKSGKLLTALAGRIRHNRDDVSAVRDALGSPVMTQPSKEEAVPALRSHPQAPASREVDDIAAVIAIARGVAHKCGESQANCFPVMCNAMMQEAQRTICTLVAIIEARSIPPSQPASGGRSILSPNVSDAEVNDLVLALRNAEHLERQLEVSKSREDKLRKALEPFAKIPKFYIHGDDTVLTLWNRASGLHEDIYTGRNLRQAREAYEALSTSPSAIEPGIETPARESECHAPLAEGQAIDSKIER